jgi:hypothetical protein
MYDSGCLMVRAEIENLVTLEQKKVGHIFYVHFSAELGRAKFVIWSLLS